MEASAVGESVTKRTAGARSRTEDSAGPLFPPVPVERERERERDRERQRALSPPGTHPIPAHRARILAAAPQVASLALRCEERVHVQRLAARAARLSFWARPPRRPLSLCVFIGAGAGSPVAHRGPEAVLDNLTSHRSARDSWAPKTATEATSRSRGNIAVAAGAVVPCPCSRRSPVG